MCMQLLSDKATIQRSACVYRLPSPNIAPIWCMVTFRSGSSAVVVIGQLRMTVETLLYPCPQNLQGQCNKTPGLLRCQSHHSCLFTQALKIYLPACLSVCPPACLHAYLPACIYISKSRADIAVIEIHGTGQDLSRFSSRPLVHFQLQARYNRGIRNTEPSISGILKEPRAAKGSRIVRRNKCPSHTSDHNPK